MFQIFVIGVAFLAVTFMMKSEQCHEGFIALFRLAFSLHIDEVHGRPFDETAVLMSRTKYNVGHDIFVPTLNFITGIMKTSLESKMSIFMTSSSRMCENRRNCPHACILVLMAVKSAGKYF